MQIVIQSYGVKEFDVSSLKSQLLFIPQTAKFYGLDSRIEFPENISLYKKLDTIKRMLVAK